MESLLLTAQMGWTQFCFGSGESRALLCAVRLPSCVSFRNLPLRKLDLNCGVTGEQGMGQVYGETTAKFPCGGG